MNTRSEFYPKLIASKSRKPSHFSHATSKIVCVGRNYASHAKELNNPIPKVPLLFIKSTNSLIDISLSENSETMLKIPLDKGECQHELEIAILIGKFICKASSEDVMKSIAGVGLGIDLTLRELQSQLKEKGHPWERAKSFDGACPISSFEEFSENFSLSDINFQLIKNKNIVQEGNSSEMIFSIISLIRDISNSFSLYPGDIILTGTPEGVASVSTGDKIQLKLNGSLIAAATIA